MNGIRKTVAAAAISGSMLIGGVVGAVLYGSTVIPAAAATTVRSRAAAGLDVTALVGTPVARYIADHHLYRVDQA